MEIKFIDLVNDFHETIKDKYEISLEELRILLKSPFIHLREIIESDKSEDIRFKNLGVFKIHKQSVRKLLEANEYKYKMRMIPEEEYEIMKIKLEKRLKQKKDDNTKKDL